MQSILDLTVTSSGEFLQKRPPLKIAIITSEHSLPCIAFERSVNDIELNKDTINITQFGAIQENYGVPQRFGTLKLFPDNMNMNEMLEHPFVWSSFIGQFN